MVPHEPPSVSVCPRGSADPGSDPLRNVVWVVGEHDIATVTNLSVSIAQAAGLDDSDVVVDLSGVTFMDASTIGALVASHNRLRVRSHSLSVRAPSPLARRLLNMCELAFLIDEYPAPAALLPVAEAIDSWVAVPASDRASNATVPSRPGIRRGPAARQRGEARR